MAISKNRLEELIKEGATIYAVIQGGVEPIDLKFRKNYYSCEDYAHFVFWCDTFDQDVEIDNEQCYETKKQAEWALKYHTTRTEELDLPMWEEQKADQNNRFYL